MTEWQNFLWNMYQKEIFQNSFIKVWNNNIFERDYLFENVVNLSNKRKHSLHENTLLKSL